MPGIVLGIEYESLFCEIIEYESFLYWEEQIQKLQGSIKSGILKEKWRGQ